MNEEAILNALQAIAFSDYTQYIWIEDGQVRVKDTRLLTDGQRAAIAGIKDTGKGVELKLHDKQKALELLVKYLGFFEHAESENTIRVEFSGVPEEWAE
ncbi:MAG: terminase small subunit [Oscillospiraceae bacterium]|nr:terminase small subunit [Oscillospiraceae bacterium]